MRFVYILGITRNDYLFIAVTLKIQACNYFMEGQTMLMEGQTMLLNQVSFTEAAFL